MYTEDEAIMALNNESCFIYATENYTVPVQLAPLVLILYANAGFHMIWHILKSELDMDLQFRMFRKL